MGSMTTDPQWFANDVAVIAAIISAIALLSSALSARYSRRQARAAERQATEAAAARQLTEKAMADQAEALRRQGELADRAAQAANRSAAAAEESAKLAAHAQRAWLTISDERGEFYHGYDGQDQLSLRVQLMNTGPTPATDVVLKQRLEYEHPHGEHHRRPEVEARSKSLGSGAVAETVCILPIPTNAQRDEMKTTGCSVQVFGRADYKDVFGLPRLTTWAYGWDHKQFRFVSLPDGNHLS